MKQEDEGGRFCFILHNSSSIFALCAPVPTSCYVAGGLEALSVFSFTFAYNE
jgi:hypothetical protein